MTEILIIENSNIEMSIIFLLERIKKIETKINERIVCGASSFINFKTLVTPICLFKYLNSCESTFKECKNTK
tara:strand:- start:1124 stop:1339 length:216 start_codon:yes stop_codon:yes gene_type:complete